MKQYSSYEEYKKENKDMFLRIIKEAKKNLKTKNLIQSNGKTLTLSALLKESYLEHINLTQFLKSI